MCSGYVPILSWLVTVLKIHQYSHKYTKVAKYSADVQWVTINIYIYNYIITANLSQNYHNTTLLQLVVVVEVAVVAAVTVEMSRSSSEHQVISVESKGVGTPMLYIQYLHNNTIHHNFLKCLATDTLNCLVYNGHKPTVGLVQAFKTFKTS